jgi:hypothetical protein
MKSLNDIRLNDIRKIITFFSVLILIAILAIIVLSTHAQSIRFAVVSLMWSLACLAGAGAVGFLFGIPKSLQTDIINRAETPYRQQPNTNLEQISDWLTKIIVGLGLYEIRSIVPFLRRMAEILASGIGSVDEYIAFAGALIIYSLAVGFLFGYLVTRVFLAPVFARADLGTEMQEAKKEMANDNFDPELAGQVLLKTEPDAFIEGEPEFEDETDTDPSQEFQDSEGDIADDDPNEPAQLDHELVELRRKDEHKNEQ